MLKRIEEYDTVKKNKTQLLDENNLNVFTPMNFNSSNDSYPIKYDYSSKINEINNFHKIDSYGRRNSPFKSIANNIMK